MSASFFDRKAVLAVVSCFAVTASRALRSRAEIWVVRCEICGSRVEMRVRRLAMEVSSFVMGVGFGSEGDLILMVPEEAE